MFYFCPIYEGQIVPANVIGVALQVALAGLSIACLDMAFSPHIPSMSQSPLLSSSGSSKPSPYVRVRGAREHNLRNINLDIPRDAPVMFTEVSGSGKSSLAFGTVYAEAQRCCFESVVPYARRLIDQVGVPNVEAVPGLFRGVFLNRRVL